MIKKLTYFILLCILAVVLITCKKYPEGGNHCGAKSRINAHWEFKQFFINGVDSTSTRSSCLLSYPKFKFVSILFSTNEFSNIDNNGCGKGEYRVINKKNQIVFGPLSKLPGSSNAGIFYFEKYTIWDIIELTDEMKLKTNYNSTEYILIMKKIKY